MTYTAEDEAKLALVRERSRKENESPTGQIDPKESLSNSEVQKLTKKYRKFAVTVISNGIVIFILAVSVVVLFSLIVRPTQNNIFLVNFALFVSLLLFIFHSRASVIEKYVLGRKAKGRWVYHVTIVISLILLGTYATLCFSIYSGLIAWPHIGSLAHLPLIIFCCGIVFQLLYLANALIRRELPTRRRGIRVISIIGGVILMSVMAGSAKTVARQQFEEAYQPLVDLVELRFPDLCNPAFSYYDNELLNGLRKVGTIRHNQDDFLLVFPAVSADIDGANIYYSSKEERWIMFHGDSRAGWEYLKELSSGMTKCEIH